MTHPRRVCVLGSGNWATVIAGIAAQNVTKHSYLHDIVNMYVYEETVNGRNLSDIINERHENVKYLPGYKLPTNVVAIPDVTDAAKDAIAVIFAFPHQFIRKICYTLVGKLRPHTFALTLIKGFERADDGGIDLISSIIQKILRIDVSVLMGTNVPSEVAADYFTEASLGSPNKQSTTLWTDILKRDTLRLMITDDIITIEIYSGLKNIIALGAGFIDGLELGDNTKGAMIRFGIMEMIKFIDVFYPGAKLATFFDSCGIADLMSSCYGGRNRRFGELFVKTGKDIETLEEEYLDSKELYGPAIAEEVNNMLKLKGLEFRFPIMTAIHLICSGEMRADQLLDTMKAHPEAELTLHNTQLV